MEAFRSLVIEILYISLGTIYTLRIICILECLEKLLASFFCHTYYYEDV